MKIQCDVCDKDEASVFCTADEAALCSACDHRVHHANKLASKHHRFALLHPSSNQFPLCDVCQERRAFLFCQQDRAILCRECDLSIHEANEHTQKHSRFLLTGIKLSASSSLYKSGGDFVPDSKSKPSSKKTTVSASAENEISFLSPQATTDIINKDGEIRAASEVIGSTSNISEYLIENLPGWHFEDFFDSSSDPFGFCKSNNSDVLNFGNNLGIFASEKSGIWVPQAPPPLFTSQMSGQIGLKDEAKEATNVQPERGGRTDDGFMVPQMSIPLSTGSKRSRHCW